MQYRYVSAFVYPVGFPLDTISDLIWLGNYLRNTMLQGLRILSVLCTRTYGLYMAFRSSVRTHILSTSYAQQTYVRTHDKYVRTHARIDYVRFNACDPLMSWSPTNVMSLRPPDVLVADERDVRVADELAVLSRGGDLSQRHVCHDKDWHQ